MLVELVDPEAGVEETDLVNCKVEGTLEMEEAEAVAHKICCLNMAPGTNNPLGKGGFGSGQRGGGRFRQPDYNPSAGFPAPASRNGPPQQPSFGNNYNNANPFNQNGVPDYQSGQHQIQQQQQYKSGPAQQYNQYPPGQSHVNAQNWYNQGPQGAQGFAQGTHGTGGNYTNNEVSPFEGPGNSLNQNGHGQNARSGGGGNMGGGTNSSRGGGTVFGRGNGSIEARGRGGGNSNTNPGNFYKPTTHPPASGLRPTISKLRGEPGAGEILSIFSLSEKQWKEMRHYARDCLRHHDLMQYNEDGKPKEFVNLSAMAIDAAKKDVAQRFAHLIGHEHNYWVSYWLIKHAVNNWRKGLLRPSVKGGPRDNNLNPDPENDDDLEADDYEEEAKTWDWPVNSNQQWGGQQGGGVGGGPLPNTGAVHQIQTLNRRTSIIHTPAASCAQGSVHANTHGQAQNMFTRQQVHANNGEQIQSRGGGGQTYMGQPFPNNFTGANELPRLVVTAPKLNSKQHATRDPTTGKFSSDPVEQPEDLETQAATDSIENIPSSPPLPPNKLSLWNTMTEDEKEEAAELYMNLKASAVSKKKQTANTVSKRKRSLSPELPLPPPQIRTKSLTKTSRRIITNPGSPTPTVVKVVKVDTPSVSGSGQYDESLRIHVFIFNTNWDFFFFPVDGFGYFQSYALDLLVPDITPIHRLNQNYTIMYITNNWMQYKTVGTLQEFEYSTLGRRGSGGSGGYGGGSGGGTSSGASGSNGFGTGYYSGGNQGNGNQRGYNNNNSGGGNTFGGNARNYNNQFGVNADEPVDLTNSSSEHSYSMSESESEGDFECQSTLGDLSDGSLYNSDSTGSLASFIYDGTSSSNASDDVEEVVRVPMVSQSINIQCHGVLRVQGTRDTAVASKTILPVSQQLGLRRG
ncbi:hypothetical protein DFH27DRAFT_640837 [Peziza echinospora]|nr:hypothetical protein DFH27DRAFT_640837 [Peziza echinospora]